MKKRTIYHIEYAKNGDIAASGGEICMLENIQYLVLKGEKNVILTTQNGKDAFIKWGLVESELLAYQIIKTKDPRTLVKLLFNYFSRVFLAKKAISNMNINDEDIIFCHSDFFPNSIPLYFLSKKNKNAKILFYFHMKYPSIFRGYEGEFIGKYSFPRLNRIYLKLNQILYLKIIKNINRGTIIGVNSCYKNYISRIFVNSEVALYFLKVFGGVHHICNNKEVKIYDGIWLGRFHRQKGIDELFEIVKILKKEKQDIKIAVIGGGSEQVENEFRENIKKHHLEENLIYKGFLHGDEKNEIFSQSKVFLMTSYFESFGLVNIEAMKFGLPVVAYNLPVFHVFEKGMIKVSILDNHKMAQEILKLLDNRDYYNKILQEALDFSSGYSWEKTSEEIYSLMK